MTKAEMTNEYWENKLLDKTIVEDDRETALSADQVFRRSDLPYGYRVLPPGEPQTRDFRPERLNVFVNEGYKVNRVYFG